MYYDTVEIVPLKDVWEIRFSALPKNRESIKSVPHAFGFFHYPRKWGKKRGFQVLKDDMIKRRKEIIAELSREIESLSMLEIQSQLPKQ